MSFLLRRSLQAALTMLVAFLAVFVAIRTLPNNPVLARFGQHASPERVAREMADQGWDRPILEQVGAFLSGVFTEGDLGESFAVEPGRPIAQLLGERIPATIELALAASLIAAPLGIAAGIVAAVWKNGLPDIVVMIGSLLGVCVPVFFLGILLMSIFTSLPAGFRLPISMDYESATGFVLLEAPFRGEFVVFFAALKQILLPAVALSTIPAAIISRIARSGMIDVLSQDYVRTARAKGASRSRTVLAHAFPNAAIPVANIAGFQLGMLLSGAVLTETVFSWPGLGRLMVDGVQASDYSVVQAGAMAVAGTFVIVNFAVDAFAVWLDPRLRGSGS
ncbi:MAG TPA: ABC transporter permease [Pirellulaceae bacterium]|nr:ABC transporter permease [Pirellulaceae bacterium]